MTERLALTEIPVPQPGESVSSCRSCGSPKLQTFLRFGDLPLSGHLLTEADLDRAEPCYPLDVVFCWDCFLVQILYTVPPEELFCGSYPYFSSTSDAWVAHAKRNVDRLCETRGLGAGSLVIELASNDGYLLQHFARRGVPGNAAGSFHPAPSGLRGPAAAPAHPADHG